MINTLSICEISDVLKIILFIKTLIDIIKFIVPIGLIIILSIDIGKGVISGNAKSEEIIKTIGNKILAAVMIFLLPTIVNFTLVIIDEKTSYESCWANAEISTIKKYEIEEEKIRHQQLKYFIEETDEEIDEELDDYNIDGTNELKKVTNNISKNYYKNFTYYLYLPNNLKSNLPIVVYLHDLTKKGNDYFSNSLLGITWGPLNEVRNYGYEYNAIIIAPQVPSGNSVNDFTKDYIKLINKVANKYKANLNKISIIGFSHGCYGVMQIVTENPKYFSAVVPVGCGWNPNYSPAEKFIYQPVWSISGMGDGRVAAYAKNGYKPLEDFKNEINLKGGNAKYTYLDGKPHNVFNNDYSILRDSNYNLINWMISQTRETKKNIFVKK